jgi:aspartyl-tRNA(Asn)/glutamyl-tRNA(Gln) amidotransferase subunit A
MLRAALADGNTDPTAIAAGALDRASSNAGRNVYLEVQRDAVMAEAAGLPARFSGPSKNWPQLFGAPISIKDCFDVRGYRTSCGSSFYNLLHGIASADSEVVRRVRQAGAVITGKTHLHQLAYGITGENRDYGDCVQPGNAAALTGGSSSGAAASVIEGSALAAIGTDTGGSIRVPAALCGLSGYRSSLRLDDEELWKGSYHLAQSFDTVGWLFRDLRDGPQLAKALLGIECLSETGRTVRIGMVDEDFLLDCEPRVMRAFEKWQERLRAADAEISRFGTTFWSGALEIFASIQAHEAAAIHRGNFENFEPAIAERLAWGESITSEQLIRLRAAHLEFRAKMDDLFGRYDFLICPCAPLSVLAAGVDHAPTRSRILRYTVPASLGGNPVVALPADGGGVQLIGARDADSILLSFAAKLGKDLASEEY